MSLIIMLLTNEAVAPLTTTLALGITWKDISKIKDSYFTHEGIDHVLVCYNEFLGDAAKLYANSNDLKDPFLLPVYGEVSNFLHILYICCSLQEIRDLFFSNKICMHLKR